MQSLFSRIMIDVPAWQNIRDKADIIKMVNY